MYNYNPEPTGAAWHLYEAELKFKKEGAKASALAHQVEHDLAFADLKYTDERIYKRAQMIAATLDPKARYSREHVIHFCGRSSKISGKIFRRLFVRLPKSTGMRNGEMHEYIVHPKVYQDLLALISRSADTSISVQIRKEGAKATQGNLDPGKEVAKASAQTSSRTGRTYPEHPFHQLMRLRTHQAKRRQSLPQPRGNSISVQIRKEGTKASGNNLEMWCRRIAPTSLNRNVSAGTLSVSS